MFEAEILATGDEIRTGTLIDSNSAWLAANMEASGLHISRIQCVGDHLPTLVQVLKEIGSRANFALVTGGLGPTSDDLSAQAAAQAMGSTLELNQAALQNVQAFFARKGRDMPESNLKQAQVPKGAEIITNPLGTAPGFSVQIENCLFFFLPGVPAEMKDMYKQSVQPKLKACLGPDYKENRVMTLRSFGLTESETAQRLEGFAQAFPKLSLGFRAKFPEIQVKLYASTLDSQQAKQELSSACAWVQSRLGDNIFSVSGKSLPQELGALLSATHQTLAVAESCTGGLIAHWITNAPGSSEYFLFAAITYANQAKQDILGVSAQILQEYGAVHTETAAEMAAGVKKKAGADYGLATTGIAGPSGGSKAKPVGTVCIGLATPTRVLSKQLHFQFGQRSLHKKIFAMSALDFLRRNMC